MNGAELVRCVFGHDYCCNTTTYFSVRRSSRSDLKKIRKKFTTSCYFEGGKRHKIYFTIPISSRLLVEECLQ